MSAGSAEPRWMSIGIAVQSVIREKSLVINCKDNMRNPDQPSLPKWIQSAYETLETAYTSDTDELSRTVAHELLLEEADSIETDGDAEYVLDRLLDRGWLYEVNGQLRKTE